MACKPIKVSLFVYLKSLEFSLKVPPRVSPHMTAQTSLDVQLETGNSPFADFTQFPESATDVSLHQHHTKPSCRFV